MMNQWCYEYLYDSDVELLYVLTVFVAIEFSKKKARYGQQYHLPLTVKVHATIASLYKKYHKRCKQHIYGTSITSICDMKLSSHLQCFNYHIKPKTYFCYETSSIHFFHYLMNVMICKS